MSQSYPEECRCSCHNSNLPAKHPVACCQQCPHCHKNIKGNMDEHIENRHPEEVQSLEGHKKEN